MLPFSIWKSTPPQSLILLNLLSCLFGSYMFTQSEPEEGTSPMFLILMILSNIKIAILIYLIPLSFLLIILILSLIHPTTPINGNPFIVISIPCPCFFLLLI